MYLAHTFIETSFSILTILTSILTCNEAVEFYSLLIVWQNLKCVEEYRHVFFFPFFTLANLLLLLSKAVIFITCIYDTFCEVTRRTSIFLSRSCFSVPLYMALASILFFFSLQLSQIKDNPESEFHPNPTDKPPPNVYMVGGSTMFHKYICTYCICYSNPRIKAMVEGV